MAIHLQVEKTQDLVFVHKHRSLVPDLAFRGMQAKTDVSFSERSLIPHLCKTIPGYARGTPHTCALFEISVGLQQPTKYGAGNQNLQSDNGAAD